MEQEYIKRCLKEHVVELQFDTGNPIVCTTGNDLVPADMTIPEGHVLDVMSCEVIKVDFKEIVGCTLLKKIRVDDL